MKKQVLIINFFLNSHGHIFLRNNMPSGLCKALEQMVCILYGMYSVFIFALRQQGVILFFFQKSIGAGVVNLWPVRQIWPVDPGRGKTLFMLQLGRRSSGRGRNIQLLPWAFPIPEQSHSPAAAKRLLTDAMVCAWLTILRQFCLGFDHCIHLQKTNRDEKYFHLSDVVCWIHQNSLYFDKCSSKAVSCFNLYSFPC